MNCPNCGGFLYCLYYASKGRYRALSGYLYCSKCEDIVKATLEVL